MCYTELMSMKECSRCSERKSTEEFYTSTRSKDGFEAYCKVCKRVMVNKSRKPRAPKDPVCSRCKRPHPLSIHGRQTRCKSCADEIWEHNKRKQGLDPEMVRHGLLRSVKDDALSTDLLDRRKTGVCEICGEKELIGTGLRPPILCVDHCHTSGHVRGLLCRTCNIGLGSFKDNVELLNRAIHYIHTRVPPSPEKLSAPRLK